jgi:hypothetical protein
MLRLVIYLICLNTQEKKPMGFFGLLLLSVVLGLIPAFIAKSKGRNFLLWWLYGTAFFIIALLHSLCMRIKCHCPECSKMLNTKAKVCKFCGHVLPELPHYLQTSPNRKT